MNTYILPFWKKIGTSSSIIAKRVSEKLNLPTSHTGTLDPMAEGVIKIIVGDDSKNKENFISNNKTYRFKFLFGISTDTHDALGIVDNVSMGNKLDEERIKKELKNFLGEYKQLYPKFSSKKVNGKSLWEYERQNLEVPEVYIEGDIFKIDFYGFEKIPKEVLLAKIFNQISLINGNFRQDEILKKYQGIQLPDYFYSLEVEIVMTRGLYVRGLARDLGLRTNNPCIILDLIRTKDGETEKKDCLDPEEYFQEEILKNQNFLFPDFRKL